MESVALLSYTNWKLNMRRRELIKPDLNRPIPVVQGRYYTFHKIVSGWLLQTSQGYVWGKKGGTTNAQGFLTCPQSGVCTLSMEEICKVQAMWSEHGSVRKFWPPQPRHFDTKHLWEKNHNHKQQNSIHVAAPPCKQASKFGPRDEFSAIVDTDLISHLVLNFKAGPYRELEISH